MATGVGGCQQFGDGQRTLADAARKDLVLGLQRLPRSFRVAAEAGLMRPGSDGDRRFFECIGQVHHLVQRHIVFADVSALGIQVEPVPRPSCHTDMHHGLGLVALQQLVHRIDQDAVDAVDVQVSQVAGAVRVQFFKNFLH